MREIWELWVGSKNIAALRPDCIEIIAPTTSIAIKQIFAERAIMIPTITSITKADKKADEFKCNLGINSLSKGYNTTHTVNARTNLALTNIYDELIPGNCENAAPNLAKIRAMPVINSTDVSTSILFYFFKSY